VNTIKRAILMLVCAGMVLGMATDAPSASAGALLPATPDSRRGAAARPNIILILADDLGYADVSAYPGGRFATPNIQRIARQGVLFTDGYRQLRFVVHRARHSLREGISSASGSNTTTGRLGATSPRASDWRLAS
jgi:Sulfatase